jgi:hypothetical protein
MSSSVLFVFGVIGICAMWSSNMNRGTKLMLTLVLLALLYLSNGRHF